MILSWKACFDTPCVSVYHPHLFLAYLHHKESAGMRTEVTAFLLYSKGQEVLDPDTFDKMQEEHAAGWIFMNLLSSIYVSGAVGAEHGMFMHFHTPVWSTNIVTSPLWSRNM